MTGNAPIRRRKVARPAIAAAITLLMLSGCMVGPDFTRPASVSSLHYDPQAEQALARGGGAAEGLVARGGDDQHISLDRTIDGDWWTSFQSAKLDQVMRTAIEGNLDLAAADATIAQANEAITAARGGLRPQVDFGAEGGRRGAGGDAGNFYSMGPSVSFDFDVFGGKKRSVEEKTALADLERHRYDAAYLTLTGDVASQAMLLASARAQIEAVRVLLANDQKNLDIVLAGHNFGSATQIDVAAAKTQLAQDETLLPPLAQQRDAARHALSVLASKGPADWSAPDFDLADFTLPSDVPVSLPSDLARNRPDILEAEAQLHAASAAIGIATADLYPHVQLSGSLGAAGPDIGTIWGIVGGLAGPLFHGGTLKANRRGSIDAYNASLARYRQTVVRSLGQVADLLQAINHSAEECAAQDRALNAAEANLRLSRAGYRAGAVGSLQVLDAERAYQRAVLGQIQARTARHLYTVQLYVALGGNANGAFAQRVASRDPN